MWPFCRVGAFWMTAITSHAAWLEKSERNVFRYNKVYFYNFLFTLFASLVCRTFRSQSRLGSRRKSNLFPFVGPPLMTSFDVAARLARSCKTVMAVNSGVYEFITVVGMEFFFYRRSMRSRTRLVFWTTGARLVVFIWIGGKKEVCCSCFDKSLLDGN